MVSYFPIEDADDTCEMAVRSTFSEKLIEIGGVLKPLKAYTSFMLKLSRRNTGNSSKRNGTMAKLDKEQLGKAHAELKNEARKRIAERGVLQFRADSETIMAVLTAADKACMPVGALLRRWVQEKLQIERAHEKAPDLVQRVSVLEQAVTDLQQRLE